MPNQSLEEQKVEGGGCGGVLLLAAGVAAFVTIGIAIFDRNRGINDGVVIAAGVFFALGILATIGLCLKLKAVSDQNAIIQADLSTTLNNAMIWQELYLSKK